MQSLADFEFEGIDDNPPCGREEDSNPEPTDYQSCAMLTPTLTSHQAESYTGSLALD